ncbi:MAG: dTMP kinase [Chloroflexi bacterium]|nr:dTMP kinase [Chloroflexota bacterium]
MTTGCFITFEGPDGSGKTTQIQALHAYLARAGYRVLLVREPGGTEIGDQIRAILHDIKNVHMLPHAEALLYSASRAQLVGQIIRPALEAGSIVLCDRYAESTLAYQGYGHGLDMELLKAITLFATGGLRSDLIIYLDIDVEEGLRRRRGSFQTGAGEWNRMDQKELDFHRRVRAGYLAMATAEPERWFIVDATRSIAAIQNSIRERVKQLLTEKQIQPDPNAFVQPSGP